MRDASETTLLLQSVRSPLYWYCGYAHEATFGTLRTVFGARLRGREAARGELLHDDA